METSSLISCPGSIKSNGPAFRRRRRHHHHHHHHHRYHHHHHPHRYHHHHHHSISSRHHIITSFTSLGGPVAHWLTSGVQSERYRVRAPLGRIWFAGSYCCNKRKYY